MNAGFRKMVRNLEYNICEMALTTYLVARSSRRSSPHYRFHSTICSISGMSVTGSGLAAAVRMNMMRHVLRAAAQVSTEPATMLDLADRLLRGEDRDAMVSAFVGVIAAGQRTIGYASAGHAPALLRAVDGTVTQLGAAGPPLGCGDVAAAETHETLLAPGSCLLLCTDGLIEWSRDVLEGEDHLHRAFSALAVDALEHPAQALVENVLATRFAGDDIAVLTVHLSDLS